MIENNDIVKGCVLLAGAVIRQAIKDLNGTYNDAYKFLNGEGLETWCDLLNLDPCYIRRQIEKEKPGIKFKKS